MSDFKPDIKLPTAIEIDKLIRRFGDPHETQHSMGERFAIADALKATTERIAELEADLRGAYNQGFSDGFDSKDKTIMGIGAAADIGFNRFMELDDRALKALEGEGK